MGNRTRKARVWLMSLLAEGEGLLKKGAGLWQAVQTLVAESQGVQNRKRPGVGWAENLLRERGQAFEERKSVSQAAQA